MIGPPPIESVFFVSASDRLDRNWEVRHGTAAMASVADP
jgi:hypothetical protein